MVAKQEKQLKNAMCKLISEQNVITNKQRNLSKLRNIENILRCKLIG
jgi:hypothetical protein